MVIKDIEEVPFSIPYWFKGTTGINMNKLKHLCLSLCCLPSPVSYFGKGADFIRSDIVLRYCDWLRESGDFMKSPDFLSSKMSKSSIPELVLCVLLSKIVLSASH
jgi:hypothetical protein